MLLEQFFEQQKGKCKKIVVAQAADLGVLKAIDAAMREDVAEAILVGDRNEILAISRENDLLTDKCEIIDEADHATCAKAAVSVVRAGGAQVLMKGNVHTAVLMHAILDKEKGLRQGELLNAVTVVESPMIDRLLFLADSGIVPYPDLKQKIAIINNTVSIVRALGIEDPKVAAVCAVESVNPAMPSTIDAAALAIMSQRGQFENCEVDGPYALDNAVSKEAVVSKHVQALSTVAGSADILIAPNIEAGNMFLKGLRWLGGCQTAGLLAGATVPVVLPSRGQTMEGRIKSIGMALAAAK